MTKTFAFLAAIGLLLVISPAAPAGQVIPNRATLNTLLSGSGVTEDFEALRVPVGQAVADALTHLDSKTTFLGQGPGLVRSGLSFDFGERLAWNGRLYAGLQSKTIEGFRSKTITINFSASVTAFGVDLLAFSGFPDEATATIYDRSGGVLATVSGLILTGTQGVPTFLGYEDAGGIGKVELTQLGREWSPILDNVTFGAAVPEPSTFAMAGLAMAAASYRLRRRRNLV